MTQTTVEFSVRGVPVPKGSKKAHYSQLLSTEKEAFRKGYSAGYKQRGEDDVEVVRQVPINNNYVPRVVMVEASRKLDGGE